MVSRYYITRTHAGSSTAAIDLDNKHYASPLAVKCYHGFARLQAGAKAIELKPRISVERITYDPGSIKSGTYGIKPVSADIGKANDPTSTIDQCAICTIPCLESADGQLGAASKRN